jgi:hypothetical protein
VITADCTGNVLSVFFSSTILCLEMKELV